MPRLRQAVLAARDLEAVATGLRAELGLGEPYHDPAVAHFGLRNAVFAVGDTFVEVVSPIDERVLGARTAGRQLERAGCDPCGYMAMLQIDDLEAARERVRAAGIREVFEVALDDISEVHLHPADMRGAIVSLSEPRPPAAWRWGGEDWARRSVPGGVTGITVAVPEPEEAAERWSLVAGGTPDGCAFVALEPGRAAGIVRIELLLAGEQRVIDLRS